MIDHYQRMEDESMTDHIQGHLTAYTDLLQNDVEKISKQLKEINLLNTVNDPHAIHKGLAQLVGYQLDTNWVVAPRQYKTTDWYLLAMHRFLSLAGATGYDLLTPEDREELAMVFQQLQVPGVFQFVENPGQAGGVYFMEMGTKQKLFYWSLERQELLFNSHALTSLLVDNYLSKDIADNIRIVADLLRTFGHYLESTFGYHVDYNILETADEYLYSITQNGISEGMLDRLFVLSAESNYFMQAITNGAAMILDRDVEMRIFYDQNPQALGDKEWHFQVLDGQDSISWLDILLDYNFIGSWYLNERHNIEIASNQIIFDEGTLTVKSEVVNVEILQPRSV